MSMAIYLKYSQIHMYVNKLWFTHACHIYMDTWMYDPYPLFYSDQNCPHLVMTGPERRRTWLAAKHGSKPPPQRAIFQTTGLRLLAVLST